MTIYVIIKGNCIVWNKLKERVIDIYKIPMKIRRETLIPFLRTMISDEDTFE